MRLEIEKAGIKKDINIPVNELEPGTVYKIKYGSILLKSHEGYPHILTHSNGHRWFGISTTAFYGFANEPATEILGKLVGIKIQ